MLIYNVVRNVRDTSYRGCIGCLIYNVVRNVRDTSYRGCIGRLIYKVVRNVRDTSYRGCIGRVIYKVVRNVRDTCKIFIDLSGLYRSFARKCEKTIHPVTSGDLRYALCLTSPLKSVLSTSTCYDSKTIKLLPYKLTIYQTQHGSFTKCRYRQ